MESLMMVDFLKDYQFLRFRKGLPYKYNHITQKKLNIIEISIKTKCLYIGFPNNEIISCCAKF